MFRHPFQDVVQRMDFSRIEMQCAAVLSVERAASIKRQSEDRIRRGDVYTLIASGLFGVPEENITPAMRQAAKKKVYWVLYS